MSEKNNNIDYTVKKSTARVYKLRFKNGFGWADITIDEWAGGGTFSAVSDYGNFSYMWGSIGDVTLREFVSNIDYGYFMNKAHPSGGVRFSAEKSCNNMKESILRYRRDGELTAQEAREAWETIENIKDDGGGEALFFDRVCGSELLEIVYGGDIAAVETKTESAPGCVGFWEEIMPILRKIWAEELAEERKAA